MAVAIIQRLPRLGPVRRLDLVLGLEGGLAVLHRLKSRLMTPLLVSQLLGQAVALLSRCTTLCLLGAQSGLGLTQLLLQGSVGLCKDNKEE